MGRAVVGIDIGTFESKGVLVAHDGKLLAMAKRRHGISTPAPGRVEHDPDIVWWQDLSAITRELAAHAEEQGVEIASFACSAIGPCVVAVDKHFRALRPAILYGVDTRASLEIEALTARLGDDELRRRSGNLLSSQSAGPKIAWIARNEPDIHAATRWYTTSQSYLVARLTGRMVIDHGTAGYFHPFYDLASATWTDDGLTDILTIDRLPELEWADQVAGSLLPEVAAELDLPPGIPVLVGTTDAPAEAIGAGVVHDADMMLMYGSSTYMIRVGSTPQTDDILWSAPFVFDGTYVLAAGTSTAGTATRWICDALGLDASTGDDAMFSEMMRLSHASPVGSSGVIVIPHLAGERTPVHDAGATGTIIGLTLASGREELARAVSEGIGHSVAHALDRYQEIGMQPSRVVGIGGGTKNDVIMATVSSVAGIEQSIASGPGAAYGDAILAALAVGLIPERRAISEWTSTAGESRPGGEQEITTLRRAHQLYVATYEALRTVRKEREEGSS